MTMRCGISTGTCAAAAAKAAAMVLVGGPAPDAVDVAMPAGDVTRVAVLYARRDEPGSATAAVRKDAGDDDDVTHGLEILATVSRTDDGQTTLAAGDGVGTVTKPGLQVPPGQPAINPVPRQMILAAVRSVTAAAVRVEISIPGGRETAQKTFNPRLGIEGGLSILGTTGIVRPYCTKALHDALRCSLDVAAACGVTAPVLVPGNIGAKAARDQFTLRDEQVIEAGNEWGFLLGELPRYAFRSLLLVGHPGKLAKLAEGQWDTHSARSEQATQLLLRLVPEVLGRPAPESPTVEGMFAALCDSEQTVVGDELARRIGRSVSDQLERRLSVAVLLVDMAGRRLGADGDPSPWQ